MIQKDYTDANGMSYLCSHSKSKPTPQVEVGQVWRMSNGNMDDIQYEILELSSMFVGDDWVDSVSFKNGQGRLVSYTLGDFLAKFERVS